GSEPGHALDHAAHHGADALFHLACRLVGEGDSEDFARTRASGGQDVGDASGQDTRLAGAGAREHQHGSVECNDRFALLWVEVAQIGRANCCLRARRNPARLPGPLLQRLSQTLNLPRISRGLRWHLVAGFASNRARIMARGCIPCGAYSRCESGAQPPSGPPAGKLCSRAAWSARRQPPAWRGTRRTSARGKVFEAADLRRAALAEPERAAGTLNGNIRTAVGGRDLVLAHRRRFAARCGGWSERRSR